ncbi:MAG: quinolinate synthase NadA [Chloroflexi bacterium]|nr:quinolinate synthase NadA [Chloroflexota bacterium]
MPDARVKETERSPGVSAQQEECDAESLATLPLEQERGFAAWQRDIPQAYLGLGPTELDERIAAAKAKLGSRLVILGHHYQRDEIIKFADYRGDSLKLAQLAASRTEAQFIVFCGVHFMAESADILTSPEQVVILPNMAAGCSMADMANIDDVTDCWEQLLDVCGEAPVPVTYINSTADLKAFCGRNGGIVCTSSNASGVLDWAFGQGRQALFFPDQHLGRNTGLKKGIPLEQMPVWRRSMPLGGNEALRLAGARIVLWDGYCSVHQRFTVQQIEQARRRYSGIKVIVHPECRMEVVQAADLDGSTEFIARTITGSPAGSQWAVGTEVNLVHRLATENPDKLVFCLDPVVCPCSTMYRIHPAYLLWVLDGLLEGKVINRVQVDRETAVWAKVALDRMLSITK